MAKINRRLHRPAERVKVLVTRMTDFGSPSSQISGKESATAQKRGNVKRGLLFAVLFLQTLPALCQFRQTTMQVTQEGESTLVISIGSYFPIKEVINYLNRDYGWLISFEDPVYPESQLVDIAIPSWKNSHPGQRGFYAPRWTEAHLRIPKPSGRPGERGRILAELVEQYNRLDREDKFSVRNLSETRNTIIGSVHGAEVLAHAWVAPDGQQRNGSVEIQTLTEQCSISMPFRLVGGTVNPNALGHTTVPPRTNAISCRDALEALTERIGDNLVYSVLEDITGQRVVVNIIPNRVVIHPQK